MKGGTGMNIYIGSLSQEVSDGRLLQNQPDQDESPPGSIEFDERIMVEW